MVKYRYAKDRIEHVLVCGKAIDDTLESGTNCSQHDYRNVMEFENFDKHRENDKNT